MGGYGGAEGCNLLLVVFPGTFSFPIAIGLDEYSGQFACSRRLGTKSRKGKGGRTIEMHPATLRRQTLEQNNESLHARHLV